MAQTSASPGGPRTARSPSPENDPAPAVRSPLLTWPVLAWGLWDWGSAAFNAVVTTFVFTVYLTSSAFGEKATTESSLSVGLAIAGACIALLAPVTGQRADRAGRTIFWLGAYTAAVVVISAALFFVLPHPGYLWLGIALLGAGNVFFELASVNYNGILSRITTKDRVGAVSGLGWGMGYIGGIVLLLILLVGFISPDVGWFGVTKTDGLNIRVSMIVAAGWFGLSAIPVLVSQSGRRGRLLRQAVLDEARRGEEREMAGLESEPTEPLPREGSAVRRLDLLRSPHRRPLRRLLGATRREALSVLDSYTRLWGTLVALRRACPQVLWFLLAAAVFRDGLAGVFTYGGVIAQNTFGFTEVEVLIFAVAANVIAGVATIASGWVDDLIGPRKVILGSLTLLVIVGIGIFMLHGGGAGVFWVLGLLLAGCVGPAQSAARSFLARVIPAGREGEIFGLYATTGRAVSFMAPMMYGAFIRIGVRVIGQEASYWGILGIVAVLGVGLLLMTRVEDPDGRITGLG